jgi:hypothetical protein
MTVEIAGDISDELDEERRARLPEIEISVVGADDEERSMVYAYVESEQRAHHALDRLPPLLGDGGVDCVDVRLERWNHRNEEWEDPSLPRPPPRPDPEPAPPEPGEPA